jgi:uncharacterized protein with PIN domain
MDEPVKLFADAMLGGLARWLRILGLDVAYAPELDDGALVERALVEGRRVLTRDTRLLERRLARNALFIRHDQVGDQVRQVLEELKIRPRVSDLFGRCLRCNQLLEDLDPAEARPKVPPFVSRTQQRFRYCPECDRVYWSATHVERMRRRLRSFGVNLET